MERLRSLMFGASGTAPRPSALAAEPLLGNATHASEPPCRSHCWPSTMSRSRSAALRLSTASVFLASQAQIVGLIGPNGSGKTTLLNVISGLYSCDQGSVTFLAHDITRDPAYAIARLGVARTFQHIHLVDDLSVLDNIAVARAGFDGGGLIQAIVTLGRDRRLDNARRIAFSAADRLGIADVAMEPAAVCRTARAGASRWRVRSQPARGSSSLTSRRQASTSRSNAI